MAMTATRIDAWVAGNKRNELWAITGAADTGGSFVAGITPDVAIVTGGTGATPPAAATARITKATKTVTIAYTSGSPTGLVLVIGN